VARLDDLDWQRAWLIYNRLPYDRPDECAYVETLIARFHGEEVASLGDGAIINGEVWLLLNSATSGSR
jgi:hypothetical protein